MGGRKREGEGGGEEGGAEGEESKKSQYCQFGADKDHGDKLREWLYEQSHDGCISFNWVVEITFHESPTSVELLT